MALAAVALGGVAVSGASNEQDGITGEQAARAGEAARAATRGGEVVSIERSDDGGATWSVVVLQAGQDIEVALDEGYRPLFIETEPHDDESVEVDDDDDDDELERAITTAERERAVAAAIRAAGAGRVVEVERSDDPGEAYELEVVDGSTETDVALDERFEPVPNRRYDD